MIAAIGPVAALLLSVALLQMGNGLQGTLLPFRADLEAFSPLAIGILGSSYFLGFAMGCLYAPLVVRRVGHIRTFAAMVAIASCTVLGHALLAEPILWWLLRAATGFCFAALFMVIESWLNEKSTNGNRGLVFSVYTIIYLTVITMGQLMLTLDDPGGFSLFVLASMLVSLAAVPVSLTKAEAPQPIALVKIRIRHLYRQSPVGVFGCLVVGMANGSFWALGPAFALSGGASTANVALFMSITVIAGAIGQWPLGRLSDKIDRRKVIVLASLGAALAGLGTIVLTPLWESGILVSMFLFGLFAFPLYALSVAHTNDFTQPEDYVETAGGLLLVYALGAIAGPLIGALVISYLSIGSLFAYTACIHAVYAAFVFYRMRQREPVPEEEQIAFADAILVSQTVSNVDPLSPTVATQGD
jgi:MFS family permease